MVVASPTMCGVYNFEATNQKKKPLLERIKLLKSKYRELLYIWSCTSDAIRFRIINSVTYWIESVAMILIVPEVFLSSAIVINYHIKTSKWDRVPDSGKRSTFYVLA
jgi:hypothetical protein